MSRSSMHNRTIFATTILILSLFSVQGHDGFATADLSNDPTVCGTTGGTTQGTCELTNNCDGFTENTPPSSYFAVAYNPSNADVKVGNAMQAGFYLTSDSCCNGTIMYANEILGATSLPTSSYGNKTGYLSATICSTFVSKPINYTVWKVDSLEYTSGCISLGDTYSPQDFQISRYPAPPPPYVGLDGLDQSPLSGTLTSASKNITVSDGTYWASTTLEAIDGPYQNTQSSTVLAGAPPALVSKWETALAYVPGLNNMSLSIGDVSISAQRKARDCCKDGSPESDGELYAEATVGYSPSNFQPIPVYALPAKNIDLGQFPFAPNITIKLKCGVYINSSFSISMTAGNYVNQCDGNNCFYGKANAGLTITPAIEATALACWGDDEQCAGVEVVPAALDIKFSGTVGYNKPEECNKGLYGELEVESIIFKTSAKLGTASWDIFTFVIHDGTVGI